MVYVSLQPGTVPNGGLATVRNTRTAESVAAAMSDGGFDPVPIPAGVGDVVTVDVERTGGGTVSIILNVPRMLRPSVVRTYPSPGKRDVPLNTPILVVFSEPIDPLTVGGVVLTRGSGSRVSGTSTVSTDGLRVTFQPDQPLDANADYVLTITTSVRDRTGDPLDQAVRVTFTTGTTTVTSWIVTQQAALLTAPLSNGLRTFSMYATKDSHGAVSGTFQIFYSDPGLLTTGRVTCFNTVDSAAWVGGVIETSIGENDPGVEVGWRAVDHGVPSGGVPDELSLVYRLMESGLGTAQQFCAATPVIAPVDRSEIILFPLLSGDIFIANGGGGGPPPPPPPPPPPAAGKSQIAYAFSGGGIQVVAADGSFASQLTFENDLYPAWSPDGKQIAFQSDRAHPGSGFGNIYVVSYDNGVVTKLTSDPLSELEPAWSPDGRHIAFDRGGDVFIMNPDGSGAARVTNGQHASWSPDSRRLVFGDPAGHLSIVNADGSGLTTLTTGSGFADQMPAWSPDGRTIAFHRQPTGVKFGAVYLVNADGSGVTQLTIKGQRPQWSQDSKRLVFEYNGIYLINIDGSGLTRIGTGFTPAWSMVGTMPPAPRADRSIAIAGGDGQSDTVHATLPLPLSVQVLEPNGGPAVGVLVSWVLDPDGNGSGVLPERSLTDGSGIASTRLTLGDALGDQHVVALVTDGSARSPGVMFGATVRAGRP